MLPILVSLRTFEADRLQTEAAHIKYSVDASGIQIIGPLTQNATFVRYQIAKSMSSFFELYGLKAEMILCSKNSRDPR